MPVPATEEQRDAINSMFVGCVPVRDHRVRTIWRKERRGGASTAKSADNTQKKTTNEKGNLGKAAAGDQAGAETDVVDALLIAMDADRDGIVTKIEMNKAMAALRKVHKDKQGNMVVPDKAAIDPNAAVAGADAGLGQGQGGVGAPATADGRNNNEAMGRFMQMDANRDGRLTLDEVPPQVAESLRDADLNRDRAIDAREMQMYVARMGDRARRLERA